MEPTRILIVQRVLVQHAVKKEDFFKDYLKDYNDKQREAIWKRIVSGEKLPHPCKKDCGVEEHGTAGRYGGWDIARFRVLELEETSNVALMADDNDELLAEVEQHLGELVDAVAPEAEEDVPTFPEEAGVPEHPTDGLTAKDVDGKTWVYCEDEDEWRHLEFVVRTAGEGHATLVCPDEAMVEMKTHFLTQSPYYHVEVASWKGIDVFYHGGETTSVKHGDRWDVKDVSVKVE